MAKSTSDIYATEMETASKNSGIQWCGKMRSKSFVRARKKSGTRTHRPYLALRVPFPFEPKCVLTKTCSSPGIHFPIEIKTHFLYREDLIVDWAFFQVVWKQATLLSASWSCLRIFFRNSFVRPQNHCFLVFADWIIEKIERAIHSSFANATLCNYWP